jgi:N-acetyl-gamma-glutamyl-phosphate reductase
MARVGIYGATGYTGFELIKLLQRHPQVEIAFATARSAAGKRLSEIYPTLIDQPLVDAETVDLHGIDLIFTCLPHGAAELPAMIRAALDAGVRVIDFSDMFRLSSALEYERRREKVHPAPDLLEQAVYGLPELHRDRIRSARLVANTGCYPLTAILPLYALNRAGLIVDGTAIVDSKSGVTGAGRSLSLGTHFGETHENFNAYKVGRVHRHLGEMEQETGLQIIFSPHLLPVLRGILSTIYVNLRPGTTPEIVNLALGIYQDESLIKLLPYGRLPELRHAVHTNMLVIGYQAVDPASGRYILVSVLDNLLKGASGQAVQNMNLMLGFTETTALI